MNLANALWGQVFDAFDAHRIRGDHTPQMALNRIAGKRIGCIAVSFDPSTCDIHEEVLPLEGLRRLKRYNEHATDPQWDVEPIVVLVYEGQRFVIDGQRRVTKWLNEGIEQPRAAIIVEPKALAR
jgi:hypothetical protein